MSYDRQMGLIWGFCIGAGFEAGLFAHWVFFAWVILGGAGAYLGHCYDERKKSSAS